MAKKGNYMLDRAHKHEGAGGGVDQTKGKKIIKTPNQDASSYSPFNKGTK